MSAPVPTRQPRLSGQPPLLLQALLGEMDRLPGGGAVKLHGTVAYAAQSAFVMNCTLRDNVLFGKVREGERKKHVCPLCRLGSLV